MFRREMPQHEGMLFVFEQPAPQCFWMKNTILPLTAAFVADDGTIVNLADMKPQTEDSHCSDQAGALCPGNEPGLVRERRTSRPAPNWRARRSRSADLQHSGLKLLRFS
jgi:hypothetical protein